MKFNDFDNFKLENSKFTGIHYLVGERAFHLINVMRSIDPDDVVEKWEDITESRREQMYRIIDFVIYNPEISPMMMHDKWMEEKLKDGWKYGEKTDRSRKIHSLIVPYDRLDKFQKAKDAIVIDTVKWYQSMFPKNRDTYIVDGKEVT